MENKYWADSTIPRDPARIDEILLLLGEVWKTEPDLRLGQLVFSLTPLGMDPFFLEDDDLKSILLTIRSGVNKSSLKTL